MALYLTVYVCQYALIFSSVVDIERYVFKGIGNVHVNLDKLCLRSPSIRFEKACFQFSYFAEGKPWSLAFLGRLFVFVERLSDSKRFPVWSQDVFYGAKWNDIYVEITLSSDEYEVNLTNFIYELNTSIKV